MIFIRLKSFLTIFLIVLVTVSISACSGFKKELGFGRNSPDEFTVVKRAPLTLPPEYDLLPPDPDKIAEEKNSADISSKAKAVVFGSNTDIADNIGEKTPEMALLDKVGAKNADADIRKEIDKENGYLILDDDKGLADKILFWKNNKNNDEEILVDPVKESERIRKKRKTGDKLDGSDVPVIKKKQSTIDKLF